jgi:hypothetical protein
MCSLFQDKILQPGMSNLRLASGTQGGMLQRAGETETDCEEAPCRNGNQQRRGHRLIWIEMEYLLYKHCFVLHFTFYSTNLLLLILPLALPPGLHLHLPTLSLQQTNSGRKRMRIFKCSVMERIRCVVYLNFRICPFNR